MGDWLKSKGWGEPNAIHGLDCVNVSESDRIQGMLIAFRRRVDNGVLETVVDRAIQMMSTTVSRLMAQANAALPDEPNKVTQVIEWVNQLPGVAWGVAVFAVAALAVAAVAVLTGNLDKIFSFFSKYFGKAETKLSEEELSFLRQQLLKQMTTDVAQRLEDSLHNLVRVDFEQEEQRHQIGRPTDRLVEATPKRTRHFPNLIRRRLEIFRDNAGISSVAPAEKNIQHLSPL